MVMLWRPREAVFWYSQYYLYIFSKVSCFQTTTGAVVGTTQSCQSKSLNSFLAAVLRHRKNIIRFLVALQHRSSSCKNRLNTWNRWCCQRHPCVNQETLRTNRWGILSQKVVVQHQHLGGRRCRLVFYNIQLREARSQPKGIGSTVNRRPGNLEIRKLWHQFLYSCIHRS